MLKLRHVVGVLSLFAIVFLSAFPVAAQDDDIDDSEPTHVVRNLAPEPEPEHPLFVVWLIQVIGLLGLLSLIIGLINFVVSIILMFAAKRPAVIAAYFPFIFLPILLTVFGALKSTVATFHIFAEYNIKSTEICGNISEIAVLPLTGLLVVAPSYFILSCALFWRTAFTNPQPVKIAPNQ